MKYVNTREKMVRILTKRLRTPLVTKFVEKVLPPRYCGHIIPFSQHALIGKCKRVEVDDNVDS